MASTSTRTTASTAEEHGDTCPATRRVCRLCAEALDVPADKVALDTSLASDLGADSLDKLYLLMAVEKVFGVRMPDRAAGEIESVGDLLRWINMDE